MLTYARTVSSPSISCAAALLGSIAILAISTPARADEFFWASPTPQGNVLRALVFEADGQTGYAVGEFGAVLRTEDGGQSWLDLTPSNVVLPHFGDVRVLSGGDLIAVGQAPGIFRSQDQGVSWSAVSNPSTTELLSLEGFGATLYAAGKSGKILRSTDEGASWTSLPSLATQEIVDQHWRSATDGYVVGPGLVRHTTNAGQTWQTLPGANENFFFPGDIQFLDELNGWVALDFTTFRTTNGGVSWFPKHDGPFANSPIYQEELAFLDANTRWIATESEGATIWKTTDDGHTWTLQYEALAVVGIFDLVRLPGGALVAVSTAGDLLWSGDGGESWSNAAVTPNGDHRVYTSMESLPSGRTFAGGYNVWSVSEDFGRTWTNPPAAPAISGINAIEFRDDLFGLVGGTPTPGQSKIARTTDGGVSWELNSIAPSYIGYVVSISAPTAETAFVAIHGGQNINWVYGSTDAGVTWSLRSNGLPTLDRFFAIDFIDAQTGYVGGGGFGSPRLWKTTNGGANWALINPPFGDLRDMDWFDASRAVVTTSNGIFRTTNGGANWSPAGVNVVGDLDFIDDQRGYAIDYQSTLWRTLDGGVSWEDVPLPISLPTAAVAATPTGAVVCGSMSVLFGVDHLVAADIPEQPEQAVARGLAVSAFPNPSSGPWRVRFASRQAGQAEVALFDASGRLLYSTTQAVGLGVAEIALDLSSARGTEPSASTLGPGTSAAHSIFFARVRAPDGRVGTARVLLTR